MPLDGLPRLGDDVAALRLGLHAVALEVAYATLAIRRRDWLVAEHHAVQAQRSLAAFERADAELCDAISDDADAKPRPRGRPRKHREGDGR